MKQLSFFLLLITSNLLTGTAQSNLPKNIQEKYDYIRPLQAGYHNVFKDGLVGCINAKGQEIASPKYDYIAPFREGKSVINISGKYGIMNAKGKVIVPITYDYTSGFNKGLCLVNQAGKYGAIDKKGKLVIPIDYDYLEFSFYCEQVIIGRKNGESLNLDFEGNPIFNFPYERVTCAGPDRVIVAQDGLKGLVNFEGKEIFPPIYQFVGAVGNPKFVSLKKEDKWALADIKGKIHTDFDYEHIRNLYFNEGVHPQEFTTLKKNGKIGLVNPKGEYIIPSVYNKIFYFNQDTLLFQTDSSSGLLSSTGQVLLTTTYDALYNNKNKGFGVAENGKRGILDTQLKPIIPIVYKQLTSCSKGQDHYIVEKDGRDGLLNKKGETVIPLIYKSVQFLQPNVYLVNPKERHIRFADTLHNFLSPHTYQDFRKLRVSGVVLVAEDKRWGAVNYAGKVIIPLMYKKLQYFAFRGLIKAQSDKGKYGVLNSVGKVIIPFEYEAISYHEKTHLLRVQKNGKWGEIDKSNQVVTPIIYDRVFRASKNLYNTQTTLVLDNYGQQIDVTPYDTIQYLTYGARLVKKGECWGMISEFCLSLPYVNLVSTERSECMDIRKFLLNTIPSS